MGIREVKEVLKIIRRDYPSARDYNVTGKSDVKYAEILDGNDKRIAWISDDQLTAYWNKMDEGS